jgi:hypothetical protein
MSANSESVKKRRQAATEQKETPKRVKQELGKQTLATCESSSNIKTRSKHHNKKALCLFMIYEEPEVLGKEKDDLVRLRSAEKKHGFEAYTIADKNVEHPRHLDGDINAGFSLCLYTVRRWKDINFDMIAFDWHNMLPVYYREHVSSKKLFEFILGAPGFLNSGGIVDIPCIPKFYESYLDAKEGLDELFDITFLREHQFAEKCFLSEAAWNDGRNTQRTVS